MTRSRYRIYETEYPYFMTGTIVGWLPVFTRPEAANIVLESWRYLQRERQFKLLGYVILENHLHLIASAPELDKAMKDFKSFTARQIVDLLESRAAEVLLRQLRIHKLPHKTQSEYQVWQEGHHPSKFRTTR